MRTLISLSAVTAAFAASLGLSGCGGNSIGSSGDGGATGEGGASNGGKTGTANGGKSSAGGKTGRGGASSSGGAPSLGGAPSRGGASSGGTTAVAGTPNAGGAVSGGAANGGAISSGGAGVAGATNRFRCENPTPLKNARNLPTSIESCERGGHHRADPVECVPNLPRAVPTCTHQAQTMNECSEDSECTAKPNGTCESSGQLALCACRYGCVTDDDCGAGSICACYGDTGSCMRATCRTDADCVFGFQCRAFQDPTTPICGSTRFECQTPEDTCEDNGDCGVQYCMADSTGVHQCRPFSCGVPGRPFLVDGCAVVAPVTERSDWLDGSVLRDAESLSAPAKRLLAAHYAQAGQLEHASIAAFARFALQLLELAAPAELVNAAQQAMAEELAHTTACFALASRFAQRPLGPGALQVTGCLERTQLVDVLRLAVREGCIGETVAAVQAGEALAHARDAGVRRALETIQRDETRHAELAFRFVRWALTQDASLRGVVLEELEQARRPVAQPSPHALTEEDALCAAYGLLPAAHLVHLEGRVIEQVVSALLCELVAEERVAA